MMSPITAHPLPRAAVGARSHTPRILLANDRVRFVGDAVAFVVADSREAARAGTEAIEVDYAELPVVASLDAALAAGAPKIWPEAKIEQPVRLGGRRWRQGRRRARRLGACHPLAHRPEPRRADFDGSARRLGEYDAETRTSSRCPPAARVSPACARCSPGRSSRSLPNKVTHRHRRCRRRFRHEDLHLRRIPARPSRRPRLGTPVKWTGERGDAFQTDTHGRAMVSEAKLGLDADGLITALAVETWSDLGAYQAQLAPPSRPWPAAASWAASIASRPSTISSMALSPTPRRSMPIAAPAAPNRPISWSG